MRHAVDLPCTVIRARDSKLASIHAVDLSPDGIRVEIGGDVTVEAGDRFFVYFRATELDL